MSQAKHYILFPPPCCLSFFLSFDFFFTCLQAVTRITERDGVSPEDALRRLQSQWPNSRQVEHANVVLSTLWEPKVTHKQVRSLTASPSHTSRNVHHAQTKCLVVFFNIHRQKCFLIWKVLKAWNLLQRRIQERREQRQYDARS